MSAPAHPTAVVDLGDLALGRGAHLLVKRALAKLRPGACLTVMGSAPDLAVDLRAWCRVQGHTLQAGDALVVVRGSADLDRWHRAEQAGGVDRQELGAVVDSPPAHWGLAARGARVEAGAPAFDFPLHHKEQVWADEAASLYRQAVAAQWDPDAAIPWDAPLEHPAEIEDALVQILTYLIENETAALIVPARFCAQVHPHFREVLQLLAVQAADEARHIEVFSRRASLQRDVLGTSSAGGQASLKTLVDEPDFEMAAFLLSVMGEGTFLNLLAFVREHAPDACTAEIMRLVGQDEARHVAFGMGHLESHLARDPALYGRLAAAVHERHAVLQHTAGLGEDVFDSLVLLAAGRWEPEAIGRGHDAVVALQAQMDDGRQRRLRKLGFAPGEAGHLSSLHTRNFM